METMTIDQTVKAIKDAQRTALEDNLLRQMRAAGLPEPMREFRFNDVRRWRFDFAWPNTVLPRYPGGWRLAVEVEGGRYARGRHVRPEGFHNDCEKYAEAMLQKFLVLRFTDNHVLSGRAARLIEETLR
jgi:hypothetical protein